MKLYQLRNENEQYDVFAIVVRVNSITIKIEGEGWKDYFYTKPKNSDDCPHLIIRLDDKAPSSEQKRVILNRLPFSPSEQRIHGDIKIYHEEKKLRCQLEGNKTAVLNFCYVTTDKEFTYLCSTVLPVCLPVSNMSEEEYKKEIGYTVICSLQNIHLISRDEYTLRKDGEMLNDQLVNYFIMKFVNDLSNVFFFDSFFYSTFRDNGRDYTKVSGYTKKNKNVNARFLIIPIHQEMHWCLLLCDLKELKSYLLDSLSYSERRDKIIQNTICSYLNHVDEKFSKMPLIRIRSCPLQEDDTSCGVHVIHNAKVISSTIRYFDLMKNRRPSFILPIKKQQQQQVKRRTSNLKYHQEEEDNNTSSFEYQLINAFQFKFNKKDVQAFRESLLFFLDNK